jgi:uncharacterized surface protein with fasciclin (FAS1) repeats
MNRTKVVLVLALLLVTMLFSAVASAQQEFSRIRVAHFSPDTPAVEIFVNGQPSGIQALSFGDISGWVELPAGTYSIAVAPYGAGIEAAAIGPANFSLRSGAWTTVAATGSLSAGTLGADVISEDYRPLNAGEARVTVFHGIEDAPAVDVILPDGTKLISSLRFGSARTLTVPAGTYDLAVVAAGTSGPAVINLAGTTLNDQTFYFVAATNRLAEPQVALAALNQSTVAPLFGKKAVTSTIAQIAANDSRFDTLVTALSAAELVDTLNGPGSFTVFAPTDAAFAKLPAATLNAVLADKDLLTTILLYHVVGGKALASDVVGVSSLNMLDGGSVTVTVNDDGVFLNGNTKIVLTDIEATNGVIHVIDTVLIP